MKRLLSDIIFSSRPETAPEKPSWSSNERGEDRGDLGVQEAWAEVADRLRTFKHEPDAHQMVSVIREAEARLPGPMPAKLLIALAKAEHALGNLAAADVAINSAVDASPGSSRALVVRGMFAAAQGHLHDAVADYGAALGIDPDRPGMWCRYGALLRQVGNYEAAETAFRNALALDPNNPVSIQALVEHLFHTRRLDEVLDALAAVPELSKESWWVQSKAKALRLQGRLSQAKLVLSGGLSRPTTSPMLIAEEAHLLSEGGNFEKAFRQFELAVTASDSPEAYWEEKYWLLLALGRLKEAWSLARLRKKRSRIRLPEQASLWSPGEPLVRNPTFLAEQGVGDELKFATCYPDLMKDAPDATITCHPPLLSLFERSFPSARFVPVWRFSALQKREFSVVDERGQAELEKTWQCGLVADLVPHYRPDIASFAPGRPMLLTDRALRRKWRERLDDLGPGPKVGFSWTGRGVDPERIPLYEPLHSWLPLLATPGVRFVSLQHGATEAELNIARKGGTPLAVWSDFNVRTDLDDLAALMMELDLVISSHSMTKELAGAVGAQTWLVYHRSYPQLAWRRKEDGTDLWFSSVRHVVTEVPSLAERAIAEVKALLANEFT